MQLLEAKAFSELTRIAGGLFLLALKNFPGGFCRPDRFYNPYLLFFIISVTLRRTDAGLITSHESM